MGQLCRQIEKNNANKKCLARAFNAATPDSQHLREFGWRRGCPSEYYPLLQPAKAEIKGIVGTWEVHVIDALRPTSIEPS